MYDPKFVLTASLLIALFTAFASLALAGDADRPVIIGTVPNPEDNARTGAPPETGDEVLTTFEHGDAPAKNTLKSGGTEKQPAKMPMFNPDGQPLRAKPDDNR